MALSFIWKPTGMPMQQNEDVNLGLNAYRGALPEVYFWQQMATPHMIWLCAALAEQGAKAVYIAQEMMANSRRETGWVPRVPKEVDFRLVTSPEKALAQIAESSPNSLHITSGIRTRGIMRSVQVTLDKSSRHHWIALETVAESFLSRPIKRLIYSAHLRWMNSQRRCYLAIGGETKDWLIARGAPRKSVFPFAYFLPPPSLDVSAWRREQPTRFTFLYVGRLIHLKRVDLILRAFALANCENCELWIVGSGAMESELKKLAHKLGVSTKVKWLGLLPQTEIPSVMAASDCLILASDNDGWGAVVSEALMCGTRVICSNACGASTVIRSRQQGFIFRAGRLEKLLSAIQEVYREGPTSIESRRGLKMWSHCLSAGAGASYLLSLFQASQSEEEAPAPPWV